jgi:hypothetical protein
MWEITYSIKLHGATEGGTGADMESKDGRKGKSGDIAKRELHISCLFLGLQARCVQNSSTTSKRKSGRHSSFWLFTLYQQQDSENLLR